MLRAFGKAVLLGTLAGGIPMMLLTVPLAMMMLGERGYGLKEIWGAILFGSLPLGVAAVLVVPSALLVGLPIWLFLRWRNWASPPLLAMIGSFAGFFILWLVVFAMGGQANVMVAFLAAFSGGVTGYFWGMGTSEDAEA